VELCTSCWEALILMGVTVMLSLSRQIKKTRPISPLEKKTMLWHQRLGHIGEKGLRTLHGKGMVEGMSNCTLDFDFCEHYIYGKKNRVRFPSGATRAKGILELIQQ
jgi:hypothetical protein